MIVIVLNKNYLVCSMSEYGCPLTHMQHDVKKPHWAIPEKKNKQGGRLNILF